MPPLAPPICWLDAILCYTTSVYHLKNLKHEKIAGSDTDQI